MILVPAATRPPLLVLQHRPNALRDHRRLVIQREPNLTLEAIGTHPAFVAQECPLFSVFLTDFEREASERK
jgi:hypothetical protein